MMKSKVSMFTKYTKILTANGTDKIIKLLFGITIVPITLFQLV